MQIRDLSANSVLAKTSMNSNHIIYELSYTQKKLDTFQAKLNSVEDLLYKKYKLDYEQKIEKLNRDIQQLSFQ